MNLSKGQVVVYIVAIIGVVAIVLGVGACSRDLTLDNRDRKQTRIQECIDAGYGGAVELPDGRGFVCAAGNGG